MRRFLLALVVIGTVAISAPWLAPDDPMHTDTTISLQAPSAAHPLGTDLLGRDVLSRTLYGGQRTLAAAALATGIAVLPGTLLGLLAGEFGRWPDRLITILTNALLALPTLVLALVILTLLGGGLVPLAVATGIALIAPHSRVTRSVVVQVRSMAYIEAGRSLGASRWQILFIHILPNILPTLIAYTAVILSYSILNGAALSFLGLGGEPGVPDWGAMLYENRATLLIAPWASLAPGLAITLSVFLANALAERVGR